ncbi:MAG: metallophosphoesterase [Planctomycetaceae bacterium]
MNDQSTPDVTILQISDLHFGPPYVHEVGEALIRIAPGLNADAVIVSGDLTQRAKREQFVAAKEFLARLPDVPRMVIPGNHDVPLYRVKERIADPHGLYREIISDELNPVLEIDGAVFVGLDSTAPHSAISNGRIRRWQLDAVQQVLTAAPLDSARIVVAHHHFAPAPDYLHDSTMPKAKRAMMRFIDLDVDMILGGHLHRAYIGNSLDIYPGRHRERGIIICQCGTSTSRRGRGREREKNSFNLIEIRKASITITHFMYFDADAGFAANSRHTFRRGPSDLRSRSPEPSNEPARRSD